MNEAYYTFWGWSVTLGLLLLVLILLVLNVIAGYLRRILEELVEQGQQRERHHHATKTESGPVK